MQTKPSALEGYLQNYGARLQSLLTSPTTDPGLVTDASSVGGPTSQLAQPAAAPATPPPAQPPAQPGAQPSGLTPMQPQPQPPAEGGGSSFRDLFKKMPKAEQKKAVNDFEDKNLKTGNETIDSAYDQMVAQLGQRPSGKLSREDKGMLLMEFGLNLMRNSSSAGYGKDLGGAIGDAGLSALQGYAGMTQGRQSAWDAQRSAIEGARAKEKADFAKQSALEASKAQRDEDRDINRENREKSEISGAPFAATDDTGMVITKGGTVTTLKDENGKPIKLRKKADEMPGGKDFEKKYLRDQWLADHSTDPTTGKPLTGAALQKVKDDADRYAAGLMRDQRTAQQKNIDDLMARGVPQDVAGDIVYRLRDNPQKMQTAIATALARTGMLDANEITEQSRQIAEGIVGPDAVANSRKPKIPAQTPTFNSSDELQAAFAAGKIKKGDRVIVGGKPGTVK